MTKNFKIEEFLYSSFYNDDIQKKVIEEFELNKDELFLNLQKLANQLQVLRSHIGKPVNINIAYRPYFWEKKQGRDGNSRHVLCQAADIFVEGMDTEELSLIIEDLISRGDMLQGGLGVYSTFVHYDIGYNGRKRRW
jgi:uncharacterized protein YcbK (DUF882 family)